MFEKRSFIILCIILGSLTGCVSKKEYLELKSTHLNTREQLLESEKKLKESEFMLQDTEESKLECLEDLRGQQERYGDLQNKMMNLSREAEELRLDLTRRKSTIQDQKKVIKQLDTTKQMIETTLKKEIAKQDIKIEEMEGKLKVTFVDKILFDQGSVEIKERGKKLLLDIAESLGADKRQSIVVEGHTDNVPIGKLLKEKFASNWELSTARAAAVVRFLQEEGGIQPERLSATGFGYYRPVASNETPEGRRQNRRIEIILTPQR